MKLSTSAAALLLVVVENVNAGCLFPAFMRDYHARRVLASQQCIDETEDLFDDSLVMAAFDAVDDEIEDKATCSGVNCKVNFDDFDSADQFSKACDDMGGKTIEVDASIDCNYAVSQITRDQIAVNGFNFKYTGLMDCVSMECDDKSIKEKIDGEIAKATLELESSTGATCTHTMEGYFSSTSEESSVEGTGGLNQDADVCLVENKGLFDDSQMLAAFEAINDEIGDKAACSGLDQGKSTCEVDFDDFNSADQFSKACNDIGGKAIEVDASIDCNYAASQITRDQITMNGFNFKYTGLMDCVSMECDDEGVKQKIAEQIAETTLSLESATGAKCSHTMEGYSLSTSVESTATEQGTGGSDAIDVTGALEEAGVKSDVQVGTVEVLVDDEVEEVVLVVEDGKSSAQGHNFFVVAIIGPLLISALST